MQVQKSWAHTGRHALAGHRHTVPQRPQGCGEQLGHSCVRVIYTRNKGCGMQSSQQVPQAGQTAVKQAPQAGQTTVKRYLRLVKQRAMANASSSQSTAQAVDC